MKSFQRILEGSLISLGLRLLLGNFGSRVFLQWKFEIHVDPHEPPTPFWNPILPPEISVKSRGKTIELTP